MQLFTTTFIKIKCKFLTVLLQQKLALLLTNQKLIHFSKNTVASKKVRLFHSLDFFQITKLKLNSIFQKKIN